MATGPRTRIAIQDWTPNTQARARTGRMPLVFDRLLCPLCLRLSCFLEEDSLKRTFLAAAARRQL